MFANSNCSLGSFQHSPIYGTGDDKVDSPDSPDEEGADADLDIEISIHGIWASSVTGSMGGGKLRRRSLVLSEGAEGGGQRRGYRGFREGGRRRRASGMGTAAACERSGDLALTREPEKGWGRLLFI